MSTPVSASSEGGISVFDLGVMLLKRRSLIGRSILGGVLGGVVISLALPTTYTSQSTFLPQSTQTGASGFALAANQLGITLPTTSGFWVSGIFVELLRSRSLLEPVVAETFVLTEEGGRAGSLMDLLGVNAKSDALRIDKAVRLLQRKVLTATDDRRLGTVQVSVSTPWPSLSKALADRLVKGVNDFNLQTRKSQATAERQFVESRLVEAGGELRDAENKLQDFLLRNRVLGSPELMFERDRLQRALGLRQQVYTSLVQSREDARIREVRDTPVITVIDAPLLPMRADSRDWLFMGVFGGIALGLVAILIAISIESAKLVPADSTGSAATFLALLRQVTLPFRRRRPS